MMLPLRRGDDARGWRARSLWFAAATVVALLAFVVFLRQEREDDVTAELKAAMLAAEAVRDRGDPETYVRELRAHLERQPRDARGWVLYARLEAELDRFAEAADAYEKAIALSSRVARDPAVWCEYADALGMARGGKLAGKPRELVGRALALDPGHPKALEMAGSAAYEQGDYAAAADAWRRLLEQLQPGSKRHEELAAAIARAERLAAAGRSKQP